MNSDDGQDSQKMDFGMTTAVVESSMDLLPRQGGTTVALELAAWCLAPVSEAAAHRNIRAPDGRLLSCGTCSGTRWMYARERKWGEGNATQR